MKKRLLSLLLCAMCVLAANSEVQYILNEGFESGIPATWTQQVMSTNTQNWVVENSNLTYPNGAFEGTSRVALRNTTGTTQDYVTRLVTPVLNLPQGSLYELKFAYAAAAWDTSVDSLTVYYSTDGGAHWLSHTGFGAAQNSWKEVSLDLIGNGSNYQLAFEAFDRLGRGIVLDAVRVFAKSECSDVENFAADAHAYSVDLSWSGDFGATFQLIVDTVSHALAELDPAGLYLHYEATTNDMVNVSGLLPEHTYYAYVRSLCADNETGFTAWKAVEFRTTIGFPYRVDLTTMPAGWQNLYGALDAQPQPNTTSYKWKQATSELFGAHVYGQTYYVYSGGYIYAPAWFVSPAVDISTLASGTPVELSFDLSISSSSTAMTDLSSSNQGSSNFYVMVSTDGGESWSQQRVCPGTQYLSAWRHVRASLNEYVGVASSVKVALVAESGSTSVYFHVKDIKIDTYDGDCGDVQSIRATNITTNSAKIAWTLAGKDDVLLQVSKDATFASLLSSDTLNLASHELVLSSLDPSTGYFVRVKQLCDNAEWAVCSFATLFGMPLVDNFDALSSGVPAGWDNLEGTTTDASYRWSSNTGGKSGRCLRFDSYINSNGKTNYLKTPNVLIGDEQVKLAFDYKNPTGGEVLLQYSLDGGKTKHLLDTLGNTTSWKNFSYVLADTLRNKSLMIIFFATSNFGSGDAYADLDNFQLRPNDPNCLGLTSLKVTAEINDAVLAWTIGGSTHEALVHVSTKADFSDTVVVSAVSGVDTLLVEGLEGNTQYYARAFQNCGGYMWIDALTMNFKTHCQPDTIPYVMGFEDETANQDPSCWTIVRAAGTYPTINNGSTYPHSGTKSLYYGSSSTQNKSIAALPAFDQPVSGLEMSFWLRAYSASCTNTLEVGVMTNPLDTNTFVRVASFQPKSATYEQQVVGFNSYQGNGKYIAFRNAATGNYGFVIDDIDVHVLPSCFRVGEIEVTEVTGQGASLYFAPANADNYQLVVATKAIEIDSLHLDSIAALVVYNQVVDGSTGEIVLDDEATFHDNTTYYIYIRSICSETERSAWSGPVVFTTNCRPFTPAQFGEEDFNNDANMACWKFGFTTEGSSTSSAKAQRTANLSKFGNVIQLTKEAVNSTSHTYNDGAYAVSPEFAVGDTINKYQIVFSAATNGTSSTNVHKLTIAIATSQEDLSDKEDIITLVLPYATDSTAMKEYVISFENYHGSEASGVIGRYVMFQSVAGTDSTNYVVIDNVRLEPISNCKKVNEASVSAITSEDATYTWKNVGATQYEVLVSTVFTKNVDTIAAPAFTATVDTCRALISGLEGNTQYYAYVRGVCGNDDKSEWSSAVAFRTECTAITAYPWSEDFTTFATGNINEDCWINEHIAGTSTSVFQVVTDEVGGNTTKKLKLPDMQVGNQTRLQLPLMNIPEANAYEFGIDMYRFSGSKPLEGIIVLAEYGQNCDTLLWIPRAYQVATATVDAESAAGWYTYRATIPFAGNGHIVLIGYSEFGNYSNADNLYVRELLKCENPKAIRVDSITETSARVHWNGSAAEYEFILMNGNAVVDSVILTDTVYHFTNLVSGTSYNYTLSLRGICGADSSDVIEKSLNFNTVCGVKSLPYANDFEAYKTGTFAGTCWTNVHVSGTSTSLFSISTSNASTNANGGKLQTLELPDMKSGTITHLTSPEFDIPAGEPVELSIDIYRNATGSTYTTEGVRLFALNGTDTIQLGFLYRNYTQTDGGVVVAERATGWYTYVFTLPDSISGITRILLQGESKYGSATYMDNFKLRKAPTCFPGSNLHVVDSLASLTTVGFGWTPNSVDNLNAHVIVKNGQVVVVDSIVNDTVFTMTGLEASHRYDYTVEIHTVCGTDESVDALTASLTFDTECNAVSTLPWTYDFASAESTLLPVCWTAVKKSGNYPNVSTYSHALYMSGGGATSSQIVALPELTAPLNTLTFTMQYQSSVNTSSSTYGNLIVGTLDETLAESSFVALDTLDQIGSKTDYELVLASAPATAKYLAVRYASGTSNSGTAYIYNVALDVTPSCLPLKNLEVKNVERRSMDIVLTPKTPSNAFDLVISTVALTDSALNVAEKISLDTTVYHVEGLTRSTLYYIYARVNCGAEDGVGPWMAISQNTASLQQCAPVIIADGTSSNESLPVYGFYCDESQKSQSIYPAAMLESLVGATITGLQYYVKSGSSANWETGIFTVSLGTTSANTMGSALLTDSMTVVYTGTLSASVDDGMLITFDQPFVYTGGNLLVQFELPVEVDYTSCEFFGATQSQNVSRYEYWSSSYGWTGKTNAFLPKVGFISCVDSAPCPTVETISHEIIGDGTSSARIAWTASTGDYANSYSVVYADSIITDWENVVPQIDSIQALDTVISGLNAYTDYYVYVAVHCDGEGQNDGSSVWSEAYRFKTLSSCLIVENLSFAATGKTSAQATWSTPYADKNFVYVLSTELLDAAALEAATPVAHTDTVLDIESLSFDQTYYLYVAHNCGAEDGLSPYLMDSIHTSASCPAVANLHAVNTTANTVTLAWNHAAFAEETEWEAGVVGRESVAQFVTDSTAFIYGLDPDMNYTIYVKAICGETEQSALATLSIHTPEAATDEVTVSNGSSTSSSVPLYGYYADMGFITQSIYPSSMMESYAGAEIKSLTYYVSSGTNYSWADAHYTISMGCIDWESFEGQTSGIGDELLTQVYSGTLTIANSRMVINLDEPFVYTGGSLAIVIYEDQPSSGYSHVYFYGTQQTSASAYFTSSGGTITSFLPKVSFGVEASACQQVKNLKANDITINSANISWMPGAGEVSWAVVLSDSVMTSAQLDAVEADTLTYKLDTLVSGLNPDVDYHFYIRSLCSSAVSDWKHLVFTTMPTCSAPVELDVLSITETSAVLAWKNITADFAGEYSVAVGKAATFNLAVDTTYALYSASDSSLLVTGLEANTLYKFAVQELCSADDHSRWSVANTFRTECAAFEVPYVENFESTDKMICWSLGDGVSVANTSSYAQSGSYALQFNKQNATVLAVLPSFELNLSELEFSYAWRCEGSSNTTMGYLEAGYVTDPSDASTFVQLLNHPEHIYSYESAEVLFPDTVPAGARPAFRYSGQTSFYYLYVDDVRVRLKPSCAKPVLSFVDATPNTVTVALDDTADYVVEVAYDAAFARRYDSIYVAQVDTVLLTGMPASSIFYVRAQRVCEEDERSDWSAPIRVATGCLPVTAFPWVEDFDSYSTGDYERPCVDNIAYQEGEGSGSTGKLFDIYTSSESGNTTSNLRLPDQKIGTLTRLYLPEMVLDTTSLYEFTMDIYRTSASTKSNEGIRLYVVDAAGVERELTFISRDYATAGALVPAESAADWYTYSFELPNDGGTYRIMLQGESQYGTATYMDNFKVVAKNANCLGVENVVVSNVSLHGADLTFNYVTGSTDAVVELATVADFSTVLESDTLTNDSVYHFANLNASTIYYVRIKQICGEGEESAYTVVSFTTGYGVRYAPVFASTSASTTEWKSATSGVTAEDAVSSGAGLVTLSGWSLTTTAISDAHFKANVFGSSSKKWLVSPSIDLSPNATDGIILTFDAALTKFAAATKPAGNMDDDRMVVLACVDDSTWFKLAEWNNAGTGDYVYAEIDSVATPYQVDLTEFAGQSNVRVAFYGESTAAGDDNDLHIAHIVVDRTDAVNYIGDICQGEDYDGAADGNPFYIHFSEYTVGDNRYVKIVNDTVCILSLTAYPTETEEYSVTVCEGDNYQDEYFNLQNITLQTNTEQMNRNQTTEHGCTKTVLMHLTINPKQHTTEQALLCPGSELEWNGQTITEPGNYEFDTTAVTGCDSIVTLIVKWDVSTEEFRDTLLHVGETMTLNDGRVISMAGDYDEVFVKESGCTHTIHWHVTTEEMALEAILDEEGVTKMVIDNHVVIIRNGVMYSVDGARLN